MPPKPSEKRQVVRFAFYKLDGAWRRLSAERQASSKIEFGQIIESFAGRLLLRPYGLVGIRGDCDFLLWQVAENLDALVALQTALNRTDLGAYLTTPYSYLAMTRRSIYEFPEDPSQPSRLVIRPSEARYLFVYPFVKTRAWYMLPRPERQTMMDEHVRIGRKYPSIRLNTTYSYGLDDQEFIVAFEGDNPADFLDLVMELRESQASPTRCGTRRPSRACRCPCGTCSTRWGARGPSRRPRGGRRGPTGTHRWRRSRICRRGRVAGCTWAVTRWRSSTCGTPCTRSRTAVPTRARASRRGLSIPHAAPSPVRGTKAFSRSRRAWSWAVRRRSRWSPTA